MQYAIINGLKIKASPEYKGIKGNCQFCGGILNLRLPNKKIHHWYHEPHPNCDKWWEEETKWHRDWKNYFPQEWQEVIHKDELTGEKHIADVKTVKGLVIEFQNSPISIEEIKSRESFYKKLVWVINCKSLENHFGEWAGSVDKTKYLSINHYCKNHEDSIEFYKMTINRLIKENAERRNKIIQQNKFISVRKDIENMFDSKLKNITDLVDKVDKTIEHLTNIINIKKERIQNAKLGKIDLSKDQKEDWDKCYNYSFTNQRANWANSKKQIFLDINDTLYLRKFDLDNMEYYKEITKEEFINKVID